MKKSTLLMTLALILSITLGIGGTMAYLQDTDEDVNVMTLGNVHIEQHEYERVQNADGSYEMVTSEKYDAEGYKLQEFTQGKPLYPAVGTVTGWGDRVYFDQLSDKASGSMAVLDGIENVQDKFVLVENTGKSDAYVRTIIAYELGNLPYEEYLDLFATAVGDFWPNVNGGIIAEIDGNNYVIEEYVYAGSDIRHVGGILPAGEYTYNSLAQVYLMPEATNETMEAIDGNGNGTYDILVVSQAVQTMGFSDAQTALDTAFGDITATSHPWMSKEEGGQPPYAEKPAFPVLIDSLAELDAALAEADEVVVELSGEQETNIKIPGGKDVTFIGNGKDTVLSGQIASTTSEAGTLTLKNLTINVDDNIVDSTGISQTGSSAIALWGNQTVICENVTFNMSLANSTAITTWWDTHEGTTVIVRNCIFNCNGQRPIRATGNVTVENCTFNDPYRYAVQLTAKADTATLLDKATINFNNNTIVNGENGKDFVYGIQLEGETYGCNDCVINGSGNTIVDGGDASTMYYCECGKVNHDTITWNVESTTVHAK